MRLAAEDWVLARLDGRLAMLRDQCPHRLAPLHAGRVADGTIECAYHGYRFDAGGACVLDIPDGTVLVLLFFSQPMDDTHTRLYTLNVRNDLATGGTTIEDAIKLGEVVLAEDRWMLEQNTRTEMPLDLTVEHHTRADRVSVEMRRVLAELVRAAPA